MKNITVLVSGGGTNLQALIDAENSGIIKSGNLNLATAIDTQMTRLEKGMNLFPKNT